MGTIQVVVDGQFGSCGKGAVASALVKRWRADKTEQAVSLAIRVAGPNAGHTVIGDRGVDTGDSLVAPHLCKQVDAISGRWAPSNRYAWALRCVPVAAVVDPLAVVALAAGSEIDLDVLLDEIDWLDQAGYAVRDRFMVDEQATVISEIDQIAEQTISTGTTGKGIGSARARRLLRDPDACLATNIKALDRLNEAGIRVVSADEGGVAQVAAGVLRQQTTLVQVEGTQGYGLGLHSGYYPFTTSSDCRAIDFLAMAGINPWMAAGSSHPADVPLLEIWVCLRPFPIRIAGNSGPLVNETSWGELGLEPELTTVTRKTRRVGHWDRGLARRALQANGGPGGVTHVALTMVDQIAPELAGMTDTDRMLWAFPTAERAQAVVNYYAVEVGQPIEYLGTGPDTGLWPVVSR